MVLFQLVHELLHFLLGVHHVVSRDLLPRHLFLLLGVQPLELEVSALALPDPFPRSLLLVALSDKNDVHEHVGRVRVQVGVHEVGVQHVVPKDRVTRLQQVSQVSASVEHVVVHPIVLLPSNHDIGVGAPSAVSGLPPVHVNVQDYEFRELPRVHKSFERPPPVLLGVQVAVLQRLRVGEQDAVRDSGAEDQRAQVPKRGVQLLWEDHQVILAHQRDLHRKGVLVVVGVVLRAMGD
mmetsp:Transcript_13249/g.37140  ORF Transcript_13249/g.37140 Transcript_13249/m.37140 type:complete len:236 (-) Transcript_13249:973-1680(-)